jgi:hypothetical protein
MTQLRFFGQYFQTQLGHVVKHLVSWVCLVGDFLFSQWKIHHDWGIDEVNIILIFFGTPFFANPRYDFEILGEVGPILAT